MIRCLRLCVCVGLMIAGAHRADAAGKCSDIPLRITVYANVVVDPSTGATAPSAIRADGGGEYADGVSGSVSIKMCSGTHDAVLNLSGSQRTFALAFPAPISGSVIQAVPSWVPGSYAASGWINIRNLTFSTQPFATMAGSTFTISGDRASYRLGYKGMSADLPNAPNLDDPDRTTDDNTPFYGSPVVVYPNYPVTCATGSMPTWLVRGASVNSPDTKLAVATLHKQASGPHGADIHEGQYSLPFEMRIEALKCFAY